MDYRKASRALITGISFILFSWPTPAQPTGSHRAKDPSAVRQAIPDQMVMPLRGVYPGWAGAPAPAPPAATVRPQPVSTAVAPKAPAPAPARPRSVTHTVRSGETLWDIAQRYGVTIDAIGKTNRLPDVDRLQLGQALMIPLFERLDTAHWDPIPQARAPRTAPAPQVPLTYIVRPGDTLGAIAARHRTTVDALVRANGLRSPHAIRIGQRLTVETRAQAEPAAPRVPAADPFASSRTAAAQPELPRAARLAARVEWPSRGTLTSYFRSRYRRHHTGIDLSSAPGTPIYAARGGAVIFSGWYYGYGKTVIIDHGNGMTTLYGHASELLVGNGRKVQPGELIARVGRTGYATGPHLHFEVRVNGTPVDPLRFLK